MQLKIIYLTQDGFPKVMILCFPSCLFPKFLVMLEYIFTIKLIVDCYGIMLKEQYMCTFIIIIAKNNFGVFSMSDKNHYTSKHNNILYAT